MCKNSFSHNKVHILLLHLLERPSTYIKVLTRDRHALSSKQITDRINSRKPKSQTHLLYQFRIVICQIRPLTRELALGFGKMSLQASLFIFGHSIIKVAAIKDTRKKGFDFGNNHTDTGTT